MPRLLAAVAHAGGDRVARYMLQLGRPRVEYICPFGHGTLKQEEYETSELENPQWTGSSGDMWEDLYAASKNERDK